ncbi:hypothetical protein [Peribacillus tepidiphilus]|uniref:hypothetical protein n=1 Tax=Peribacillus tepidiphilus TaxID=2652445 RepID=UPI0035B53FAF
MKKALITILILSILPVTFVAAEKERNTVEERTAFVHFVSAKEGNYAKVDWIEWYEGEKANQEAEIDGECYEEEGKCVVPDGYYIRNSDTETEKLPIDQGATFIMQTYQLDQTNEINWNQEVTQEEFMREVTSKDRYEMIPFHLKIKDGKIISITEQYIP